MKEGRGHQGQMVYRGGGGKLRGKINIGVLGQGFTQLKYSGQQGLDKGEGEWEKREELVKGYGDKEKYIRKELRPRGRALTDYI